MPDYNFLCAPFRDKTTRESLAKWILKSILLSQYFELKVHFNVFTEHHEVVPETKSILGKK